MGPVRSRVFAHLLADTPVQPPKIPPNSFANKTLSLTPTLSMFCAEFRVSLRKQGFCDMGGGGYPMPSTVPVLELRQTQGPSVAELLQIPPIRSHAEIHLQRDLELEDVFHLLYDQRLHYIEFGFGDFEHQLVVHLQQHARFEVALAQFLIDANHGQLNEVGGGALQQRVDNGALGSAARHEVLAEDVGEGSDASEQRRDAQFLARLLLFEVDE